MGIEQRFWSKVEKSNGCWLWKAGKNEHGYGILGVKHHPVRAHRISYRLHFGEIPKGLFVCHHCDTPACVRPDHLYLGTQFENMRDCSLRNRLRFPGLAKERNPSAKLTMDQARLIRSLYPKVRIAHLARQFSVSDKTIYNVISGRLWKEQSVLAPSDEDSYDAPTIKVLAPAPGDTDPFDDIVDQLLDGQDAGLTPERRP